MLAIPLHSQSTSMAEILQEEFDKIQRAVAFTRGFKRDGIPKARASLKKLKTGDDDVNLAATSHGIPQEEADATPFPNVFQEEVAAPSYSQDIPDAPVKAPSTTASTAQHIGSSPKKVGTRKKRLGRKGVHPSHSTIPIKDGDPEAEHKMCIKYASDVDSASDDDNPVNFFAVVDWELLPTGLGWINVIYRKDNSRKCFISLREILHLVTRADLMTIYGRVMTFYQDKQAEGVGLVLWGDLKVLIDSLEVNNVDGLIIHMFVDKKYPLSVNLIERMLDHQLEICPNTVVPVYTKVAFGVVFKMLLFNPLIVPTSRRKDLSRVGPTITTAKGKDTCLNSELNLRGNEMIHGLRRKTQTTKVALTVVNLSSLWFLENAPLAEVHNHDNVNNNMINQAVQAMQSSEQSNVVNHSETEITSDSNIIPYSQYVIESQQAAIQNSNSSAQQDALILSVIKQLKTQVVNCTKINLDNKSVNDTLTAELERYKEQVKVLKEGQNVDLRSNNNVSDSCAQSVEIDRLKQTLSEHLKEKESLMQTVILLKNDFKKEESRNIDREIALKKGIKKLDNIVFKIASICTNCSHVDEILVFL
ncbi:hypothetical protein Tco_0695842 [Tanacetum coccineum]